MKDPKNNGIEHSRTDLARDALLLQGKLLIDGLRDLVLVPISIIAALIDLLSGEQPAGRRFYNVVQLGRRSEHWINLFGAAERSPHENRWDHNETTVKLDDLVDQVEKVVRDQYTEGGVSGSAKRALNKALDVLHENAGRKNKEEADND
ncbi:MAG: hypothetical protein O6931_00825 [Gammaproteobacteria bacterium]|nr:hypothetical protein [Gammaproteobacteria bacterium]